MPKSTTGYSSTQIGLHWAVVVLVAFQYFAHNGIEATWGAMMQHQLPPSNSEKLSFLHVGAGLVILLLALARIVLRVTRGAPAPPADEPRALQLFATTIHLAIYALLILLPSSGLIAWFFAVPVAGATHAFLETALLAAIALHVAGALFQHFVRRSDVLMRMLRPEPDEAQGGSPSPLPR